MHSFIGRTPFFRLLLPVVVGILAAALLPCKAIYMPLIGLIGLLVMLSSFFIKEKQRYRSRWLFGAGLFLFLFTIANLQYHEKEKGSYPSFQDDNHHYVGTVLNIPEVKPRSIACHIKTTYPVKKRVVLYLQQTDEARILMPGDELLFQAKIEPFRNFGNPDDFDYAGFMKIKGFSGSAFIPEARWHRTGRQHITLPILSQRCRAKALDFYRSFQLDPDAYAFITAITLGYKAYLSDDLQEAFRASGTAHVLAVSGLHVGIIYLVINFLFSFLGNHGKRFVVRQLLVILTLWGYALVAGMSAPVIRAAFMLTIYGVGRIQKRAGFSYNTLAAAAFFLLLSNPFNLFDVSFQMSFMAVCAILFFQPKVRRLYKPKGKITRYIWNLSTVSLSAQLGVFPLVLYHFGSFPTYFFIANLLVVPLLSLAIYAAVPLTAASLLTPLNVPAIAQLEGIFQWVLKTLIECILQVVYITETLPYAQLTDKYLSVFQSLLLLLFTYLIVHFFVTRRPRPLITALAATLIFLTTALYDRWTSPPPQLVVFNSPSNSEIGFYDNNRRLYIELPWNGLLPHPKKSILRLSDGTVDGYHSEEPLPLDILLLSHYKNFNIDSLLCLFDPQVIVLDSSIPPYTARRLTTECYAKGVMLHDVSLHGAYSIFF